MVMGSEKRVKRLKAQGELYKCPSCGYEDGFHVSFLWGKKGGKGEVYLICPNCHGRFRLSWNISVSKTAS